MTESNPPRKPRRGTNAPAAEPGFAATERAHELWSAACTTVALAALSFWSLSTQLAAGIEMNQAVVTVGVVLLCVGRARGHVGGTLPMLPGYTGGAGR
ncbi:hypothetical protein [Nocardia salmonicida]|uniref:hypothetical protein n=1 Tax=Nocardia salmonicida TaxID=53431 RepID=UPI003CF7AEB3